MAAKMTLSIPDDMYDKVKAAEGLNVSGVLQGALEAELRARELIDGGDERAALIQRLRAEEDGDVRVRYPVAYLKGKRIAAAQLSRDDIEALAEWYGRTLDGVRSAQLPDRGELEAQMAGLMENSRDEPNPAHALWQWLDEVLPSSPKRTELVAFVAGIFDLWEATKNEL